MFNLSSIDATEALSRLLLGSRNARVRLLVDDPAWLDTGAARLRLLQQRFPHALELRVASQDDPVGDDAQVLADDHAALELRPTPAARGDLWLHNKPHAQTRIAAFDRRWDDGVPQRGCPPARTWLRSLALSAMLQCIYTCGLGQKRPVVPAPLWACGRLRHAGPQEFIHENQEGCT